MDNVYPHKLPVLKPRSEVNTRFNALSVIDRNDRRIMRLDKVSTHQIEEFSKAGIVLVIIPSAMIFIPKYRKEHR